jgi:hypothetical protein
VKVENYTEYAAFLDCIRWCFEISKRGIAQLRYVGDAYRCRLSDEAVNATFTLVYDEGGQIHMYYPSGPDHLWLGAMPWEKFIVSKKRTLLALACPPITPPGPFPVICASYFCLDIPCSPALFSENVIIDSLGIRSGSYVNGVLTPVGSSKVLPVDF